MSAHLRRRLCLQTVEISCLRSTALTRPGGIPTIKLASLSFPYRFPATKRRGPFVNADNLRSSHRQSFPESPAEMNEWISGICSCNVTLKHKIFFFFFFSCTGKALLMWFLSKKSLLFFFPGIYFLESYHIISPHKVTIPFLFILCRTSLILSGGLALSAGQLGGWVIFFSQFTASVCGNVTNLIPSIQQIFILKRKIISVSIFKQKDCFINTKTKI